MRQKKVPLSLLVAIAPICIAINLSIGLTVHTLKLPIYLDSIGTVLAGFLIGPWWAAAIGAVSMLLGGLIMNPYMPYYAGTAAIVGITAGSYARFRTPTSVPGAAVLGVLIALFAALASAPNIA